jgi:hypothetical protein
MRQPAARNDFSGSRQDFRHPRSGSLGDFRYTGPVEGNEGIIAGEKPNVAALHKTGRMGPKRLPKPADFPAGPARWTLDFTVVAKGSIRPKFGVTIKTSDKL